MARRKPAAPASAPRKRTSAPRPPKTAKPPAAKPKRRSGQPSSRSGPRSVVVAVRRDLKRLERELAESALAATALALAAELDQPKNSATSKSMCARALSEVLTQLRGLQPPATEGDRVDELETRRAKRLSSRKSK